jgi:hypothetical protein
LFLLAGNVPPPLEPDGAGAGAGTAPAAEEAPGLGVAAAFGGGEKLDAVVGRALGWGVTVNLGPGDDFAGAGADLAGAGAGAGADLEGAGAGADLAGAGAGADLEGAGAGADLAGAGAGADLEGAGAGALALRSTPMAYHFSISPFSNPGLGRELCAATLWSAFCKWPGRVTDRAWACSEGAPRMSEGSAGPDGEGVALWGTTG